MHSTSLFDARIYANSRNVLCLLMYSSSDACICSEKSQSPLLIVLCAGFFIWSAVLYILSAIMVVLHTTSCKYQEIFTCRSLSFSFEMIMNYNMIDRFHLLVHFVRAGTLIAYCLTICRRFRRDIQAAVSQNRRRYYESSMKIDLDLTYVCDRVIAMSLPCVGDAVHRNDISEVRRSIQSNKSRNTLQV
jgi:hypothetical protein